ncbi:hypothetical protein NIES3807_33380 [Microcystis aeruginosa NIES-3807]|uniref:Uncharacterized protein n=2 Tax=Microcystis TaxID=1125 RepID=A0AAD3GA40_MICAE|nr:hypothetical protein NIES3807_33380 [Microcystis aeruginosa NIES-3807]
MKIIQELSQKSTIDEILARQWGWRGESAFPKLNRDCCRESERKAMNIKDTLHNFVQYLTEAFARIFSPNNDEYPDVGMQPFDSEPYHAPKSNS